MARGKLLKYFHYFGRSVYARPAPICGARLFMAARRPNHVQRETATKRRRVFKNKYVYILSIYVRII